MPEQVYEVSARDHHSVKVLTPVSPQVPVTGWLQAFAAHPKLGRVQAALTTSPEFLQLSKGEQAGVASAPNSVIEVTQVHQWGKHDAFSTMQVAMRSSVMPKAVAFIPFESIYKGIYSRLEAEMDSCDFHLQNSTEIS